MKPQFGEAAAVLGHLIAEGVELGVEAGDITFAGRPCSLNDEVLNDLRSCKPWILALIEQNHRRGVIKLGATSLEQQRMEWRSRSDRNRASYNVCLRLTFSGDLEPDHLESALVALVERHEILRTRFAWYGAHLLQEVMVPPRRVMTRFEPSVLHGLTSAEIETWCEEQGAQPFDLADSPPVRWYYAPVGPATALLLVAFHHIACDGWSIDRLLSELARLCDNAGSADDLPPVTATPCDFARWEIEWLDAERVGRTQRILADELSGATAAPCFLNGRVMPAPGGDALCKVKRLSSTLVANIQALARSQKLSEFALYFAAYTMLLNEQTGGNSCIVVIAVLNRTRPEHEEVVGLTRNAYPIRCSVTTGDTLISVARRMSDRVARASEHQWFPISMLELHVEKQLDPRKLPVTFGFTSDSDNKLTCKKFQAVVDDVYLGAARAGFSLLVKRCGHEAHAFFEFALDYFQNSDIDLIADRYVQIVAEQIGS